MISAKLPYQEYLFASFAFSFLKYKNDIKDKQGL